MKETILFNTLHIVIKNKPDLYTQLLSTHSTQVKFSDIVFIYLFF